MQQDNYTTFRPELKEVIFKNTKILENECIFYTERKDNRNNCENCDCRPHIADYRTVKVISDTYKDKKVIIYVKKQRYKCPNCNKKWTSKLEDVEKYCNISNSVKEQIIRDLKKMRSIKEIANDNKVSHSFAYTVFSKLEIKDNITQTKIIYMDEFKGNASSEKYQLALYNETRDLITILPNRKSKTIKTWLNENNQSPEIVVTDMFMQFRKVINSTLPKAKIVADKFHVLRQLDWFFRDVRLDLIKKDKKKNRELKTYWKLLMKKPNARFTKKQRYKLKKLLNLSDRLRKSYYFRKRMYDIYEIKKTEKFEDKFLDLINDLLISEDKKFVEMGKTLYNWYEEISNSYRYKINNGFVEGKNNKIKVIKRLSFGIRKFKNLKKRIQLNFT